MGKRQPGSAVANGGRPAIKRQRIVAEITRRITGGEWRPGQRIPPQTEIEREFDAGNPTVQQAVNRLVTAGFLEARGTRGTFVVARPPHLHRYGLVFPGRPGGTWSRLYDALNAAALALEKEAGRDPRQFAMFYEVDEHPGNPGHRALLHDVHAQRLAGLIFATSPFNLVHTPLLESAGLPRVAVASEVNAMFPHVAARYPDLDSFVDRSLAFLASPAGGRRQRVAFLAFGLQERMPRLLAAAQRHGLRTASVWVQSPHLGDPLAVHACVQLLLHGPARERPDALVIADDNYVEEATRGLLGTGLRIPQELTVVAQCNFPVAPPTAVPVVRLGFDARSLLEDCVDCIDCQRGGRRYAPVRLLPAVFESELESLRLSRPPAGGQVAAERAAGRAA